MNLPSRSSYWTKRWHPALVALVGCVVLLAQTSCSDKDLAAPAITDSGFSIMTWNVYVGADLNELSTVTSAAQIPSAVGQIWNTINRSQPTRRLQKIAATIARERPHLVGLQEVALFRRQSPGDAALGGTRPATDVALDYLAVLLEALRQRGISYRVAVRTITSDIEVPMFTGGLLLDDLRFTDQEVILARQDVATVEAQGGTFEHSAVLGEGDLQVSITRGWASVVVQWNGQPVRFLSTHLQTEDVPSVQVQQAEELIAELSSESRLVFLVGDLNSRADDSTTETIQRMRAAGFGDLWEVTRPGAAGATCCQEPDLRNATSALHQRIDYILVRGAEAVEPPPEEWLTWLRGVASAERTAEGLWTSDHAGLQATWPNSITSR